MSSRIMFSSSLAKSVGSSSLCTTRTTFSVALAEDCTLAVIPLPPPEPSPLPLPNTLAIKAKIAINKAPMPAYTVKFISSRAVSKYCSVATVG